MPIVDYFLQIEGIPGDSSDIKHPNEIMVEAWSFGESELVADATDASKVKFRDFHFAAAVSKASPKLIEACAQGRHVKSATLTCRRSAGFQIEFLVLKFADVVVASYETGAASSSETMPVDHVALAFAKVEVHYTEQKPDGTAAPPIQVTV